jgi:acyl dehydratase
MKTGLHFEDFAAGQSFETESRALTESDLADFARLSGDHNALHSDDDYARGFGFRGRIAQGVLALSAVTGLINQLGITRGTLLAFLGLNWSFRRPVYPGDTVRARIRVGSKRLASDSHRGVVVLEVAALNQEGEVVQDGEFTVLVRCRAR